MSRSIRALLVGWARTRPRLTALTIYAFGSIVFFAPGLLPGHTTSGSDYLWTAAPWNNSIPEGVPQKTVHPPLYGSNPELVDPATVFEPFLQYTKSQLPHIPLWDPYIMGGTPYLADMQSAIFSPFSVPAYVLPFWWSLTVIAILKLVVAAMGTFLLARALGMRFAAALLSGTVFGFSLFLVAWVPWPLANVFPLIPWLLLATERLVRRPCPLSAAGLAAVVGLQFFGGHPESSFHALFATGSFFVLRVLQAGGGGVVRAAREAGRRGGHRARAFVHAAARPTITFVAALVVGTALAAIVLLPFLELLHNSSDLTSRPRSAVYVPPKYFVASVLPGYYPDIFEVVTAFYVGALPLLLAAVAMFRLRVERVAVAAFTTVSLLVVLGVQPFFRIVAHAPGFHDTYNSRLTILYVMGMALLAGWGVDDLLARTYSRRTARLTTALGACVLSIPIWIVVVAHTSSWRFLRHSIAVALGIARYPNLDKPHAFEVIRLAGVVVWIFVAGSAVLLLYARMRRRLAAGVFAVLAVLLVAGDLFQAGMGQNPAIPDSHADQPATPAIQYLQKQVPARFAAVNPKVGVVPLPPDTNLRYGLYDARGYDYPVPTRFARMWNRYVAPPIPLLSLDTPAVPILFPTTLRILSLLGVRDLLQQADQPPLTFQGLHVVYRGKDATVYANDNALPRTWLVNSQRVVNGDEAALEAVVAPGFPARSVVVSEERIKGLPVAPSGASVRVPSSQPGSDAKIESYAAQKVLIEAHAEQSTELVLSDTYYPGWTATVDGKPAHIDLVDYMFRGVLLPPGTHEVVFTYQPNSFSIGRATTLVALVVIGAAAFFGWRRRREKLAGAVRSRDDP